MIRVLTKLFASVAFVGAAAFVSSSAGCGSTDDAPATGGDDAGLDGSLVDGTAGNSSCVATGGDCAASADCCSISCDAATKKCVEPIGGQGVCKVEGEACASPTECCAMACTLGVCGNLCTGDNEACSTNEECCGGVCSAAPDGGPKTCKPLTTACKTSGNKCAGNAECCSAVCTNGICNGNASFCSQLGDSCASDGDCCTGLCTKAAGAPLGLCSMPNTPGVPGCAPAGQICTGSTTGDGGLPSCGGNCCSRSCRPYAATGVLICQPPSGCRPTGELCQVDSDCCGALGSPGSTKTEGGSGQSSDVHCSKAAGAKIGRCDNGKACSPAGAICRLAAFSCNATDRCCAGTVQTHPLNCKLDVLGIPRCTAASDYDCTKSGPPPAGTPCASSADCCNNPCVPNPSGNPPFVCGTAACVPTGGACTTTADCCAGSPCNIPAGSTKGTCGATTPPPPPPGTDAGSTPPPGTTPCAQYGQQCTQTSDCCNGVPCTNGRCGYVIR